MEYHVTRQNGFYDEEPRVEIALGLDNISPGMLVGKYETEGYYDGASDAVEAALQLARDWHRDELHREDGRFAVTISSAASLGAYPTADDGDSDEELHAWAARRAEACGEATDELEEALDD
jgi:hypothetical protein